MNRASVLYSEMLEEQLEPGNRGCRRWNPQRHLLLETVRDPATRGPRAERSTHSSGGEATSLGTVKYMGYGGQEVLTVGAP